MTLFLHPTITPAVIAEAAAAQISGVKYYPANATTNSQEGVVDLEQYFPVLQAMEAHNLVLNLHGEVPNITLADRVSVEGIESVAEMNAETMFLPMLRKLHMAFPQLRIVLEHCSTRKALDAVRSCGPTVAATITAHHLWMTADQCCGDPYSFCKPVAKTIHDRKALLRAVVEQGTDKFFFGKSNLQFRIESHSGKGSDSAPHPVEAKKGIRSPAAGCFTQGWATQLVVSALEEAIDKGWIQDEEVTDAVLAEFLGKRGRRFYGIQPSSREYETKRIILEKLGEKIPASIESKDGSVQVVPFKASEKIWSLRWKS